MAASKTFAESIYAVRQPDFPDLVRRDYSLREENVSVI